MKFSKIFFCFLLVNLSTIGANAEIISLPASIPGLMVSGLYSDRSEIEDLVQVKILEPVNLYSDRVFVPAGSVLEGRVEKIKESGRGLQSGKVKVSFDKIIFPNGFVMAAMGYLSNGRVEFDEKKKGVVKGKFSLPQRLLQVGKVGAGALVGGPIGAAAAAGTLIFEKGGKVRIAPGDDVFVVIEGVGFYHQQLDLKGKLTPAKDENYSPNIK
jgi:hypothetical protein